MKNKQQLRVTQKEVKRVQKIIILLFALIIALDFIFVLEKSDVFPSVSKVIHKNAAQNYFVITWIWGVLTPQLFIERKPNFFAISLLNRAVIVLALTGILLIIGQLIDFNIGEKCELAIRHEVQAILFLSGALTSYFLWPNYSLD
ncbi:MAG: hypothetical protein ACR2MT_07390 [Aurantibacter sp.]